MKTIEIKFRQDPERTDLFHVVSFQNTIELSVGDVIPRAKIADWLSRPTVKIAVIGMLEQPDDESLNAPERTNRANINELTEPY